MGLLPKMPYNKNAGIGVLTTSAYCLRRAGFLRRVVAMVVGLVQQGLCFVQQGLCFPGEAAGHAFGRIMDPQTVRDRLLLHLVKCCWEENESVGAADPRHAQLTGAHTVRPDFQLDPVALARLLGLNDSDVCPGAVIMAWQAGRASSTSSTHRSRAITPVCVCVCVCVRVCVDFLRTCRVSSLIFTGRTAPPFSPPLALTLCRRCNYAAARVARAAVPGHARRRAPLGARCNVLHRATLRVQ